MYASVRTYAGNSDLADALAPRVNDLRQVIGAIDGFRAYYLVKTAGGTTSISVYDDQAGAEESNRAAAAWLADNMPDLEVASPQVEAGEVVVDF